MKIDWFGIRKRKSIKKRLVQADELEMKNSFLKTELSSAREEYQKAYELSIAERDKYIKLDLLPLFNLSDDELLKESFFPTYDDPPGYCTNMCQLGGCEFITKEAGTNRRDVLLLTTILTRLGERPSSSSACPSCYSEYMSENAM